MWLMGYGSQLLQGVLVTLAVSLSALLFGLLLGVLAAWGSLSTRRWTCRLTNTFTAFIRGLPELLVLLAIYFGGTALLTQVMGRFLQINAFLAGVFGLGLIFAAYSSKIIAGAFLAIPAGQKESAQSLGLSGGRIFCSILLPQAWRYALPGLGNLWLVLLKDSALVSLLGLSDLMNKAQIAASSTHQPFKFYMIAAFIFLLLTTISQLFFRQLVKRAAQ